MIHLTLLLGVCLLAFDCAAQPAPKGTKADYPDHCWFEGLQARIAHEYPELEALVGLHKRTLYWDQNYLYAAELHKSIYKRLFEIELSGGDSTGQSGGRLSREQEAAYRLVDIWAGTPGDYSPGIAAHDEMVDYFSPEQVRPRIEFWSYCFERKEECAGILDELSALAAGEQLGPAEMRRLSMKLIERGNSFKVDLMARKLASRGAIKLEELGCASGQTYELMLERLTEALLESTKLDTGSFYYVFAGSPPNQTNQFIDSRLESYLAAMVKDACE